jgi:hypothetical protein
MVQSWEKGRRPAPDAKAERVRERPGISSHNPWSYVMGRQNASTFALSY